MKMMDMRLLVVFVIIFLVSITQTTVFCADIIVDTYTKANLPAAGTQGRLAEVTDDVRGLWMDVGSQWCSMYSDVKVFGAKGDGVTDDITPINSAVNAVAANGGGTVFFPAGTYIISAAIPMKTNVQYVGAGWASILKSKSTAQDNIFGEAYPAAPVSNVTIRDLQIDGNKANVNAQADDAYQNGIRWDRVSHSRIINTYIHDTVFNGISNYNDSDDNVIAWNRIENIGKSGASGSQTGIFLEFAVDRNKVIFNRINTTLQYGIWEGGPGANNSDNLIEGNLINGTIGDGIRVGYDLGGDIINRTQIKSNIIGGVVNSTYQGIRVYHAGTGKVNNVRIEDNTVTGGAQHGILIANSAVMQTIVMGNHILNNVGTGILVSGNDTIVANNVLLGNGTQYSNTGTRTVASGNIIDTISGKYIVYEDVTINATGPTGLVVSRGSGYDVGMQLDQSGVAAWTLHNIATSGTFGIQQAGLERLSITTNGAVTIPGTLAVGGDGAAITRHLSATTTWDPPSISNGAATSTTLTVSNAVVGNTVAVGFSTAVPGGALLVGAVTAANTVTVTLANHTGGALNLASGTLRADVWQH
ncbi:MAG: right-handed parallel beta-helix repeat-containing protein [Planctomycetes bacterium]|nr:right-handed parallel beta-helix repeat-containing protein [Planctomycetota bacterium]